MSGVADQGHPGHPAPSMLDRQRIELAKHRHGVGVGDQRGEFRCPAGELVGDPRYGREAIGEVDGEDALTFRALAAHLATGSGAIYWHVANKNDLLAAATDHVFAHAMAGAVGHTQPREAIRAVALGVFDALDAHPWVGAQLPRGPWSALLQLFEGIGGQVQALGVPDAAQFNCASALVNYILGVAQRNAASARLLPREIGRSAFLGAVTARWTQHDRADYPFVHQVATQLREHDDREQFLAGVDIFLAGVESAC